MPSTILGQIGTAVGGWLHPLAMSSATTESKDYFNELSYSDGNLSAINVYVDNTKTQHLFNKVFTYDATKRLISVVTTKYAELDNVIYTQTIAYDSDGNVMSITKDYA